MEKFKFARQCDATKNGMNEGYVVSDGMLYFSTREYLLEHLRSLEYVDSNGKLSTDITNDNDLLDFFYNDDYYYYTTFEQLDSGEWYCTTHENGKAE